jgi:hypothetical protein
MGASALVVKEIKDSNRDFDEISFSHEGERSNLEAHSLARGIVLDEQGRRVG